MVLKFEPTVKIKRIWWRHHFKDNESMKFYDADLDYPTEIRISC